MDFLTNLLSSLIIVGILNQFRGLSNIIIHFNDVSVNSRGKKCFLTN